MQATSKVIQLQKSPYVFRKLTGITVEKFKEICKELNPKYKEYQIKRLSYNNRKRNIGGGKQYTLGMEDKFLMLLMYYRCYTTHVFLGFIFGIDDSNVSRNMNPLQSLLAGIFKIPEKRIEMSEDEILELFFDGTEQQTQRPGKGQKKWYSGKKKKHTIKHQVVVSKIKTEGKTRLRIKAVSKSFYGKTHDKKIYDKSKTNKPPGVPGSGDTAYLGTVLAIPHKSSKKKKLTQKQKKENRKLSSKRVVVEHAIGKMKIWHILSQRFRNKRKDHTLIFKNIAGLHNLMFS